MILVLDNYDSFTYNLVQYLGELGAEPDVVRNDQLTVEAAMARRPDALLISPGPCTPAEAGISVPLLRAAAEAGIPTLGVCLGHQAMGEAFGGTVVRAERQMHGKTSEIVHDGQDLFAGLLSPLPVMRYHSLIIAPETVPAELEVTAWTTDRPAGSEIMAVRHRSAPMWGVQFHPESVATPAGKTMLVNFLSLTGITA
jgi:anthranilate synthase component II